MMGRLRAETLREGFHFTSADLADNAAGILSPRQQRYLLRQAVWPLAPAGAVTLLSLLVLPLGVNLVCAGLAVLVGGGLALMQGWRYGRILREARIITVIGPVRRKEIHPGNGLVQARYRVQIGERWYNVPHDGWFLLREGQTYTAYTLPPLKRILSLEPLDSSDEAESFP